MSLCIYSQANIISKNMAAELEKLARLHVGQRREIAQDLANRVRQERGPKSLRMPPRIGLSFSETVIRIGQAIIEEDYIPLGTVVKNVGEKLQDFSSANFPDHSIEWGRWIRNPQNGIWNIEIVINNTSIPLTVTEAQLLSYFIENPNILITKNELLENVWGWNSANQYHYSRNTRHGPYHVVDTNIYRLRKKLNSHPDNPICIDKGNI